MHLACCDDIIDKPVKGTGAQVMFVSAFVPNDNIKVFVNGRRQRFSGDGGMFVDGENNDIRLSPAPSYLVAIAATPPTRPQKSRPGDDGPPLGLVASLEQHTPTPHYGTTDSSWKCR